MSLRTVHIQSTRFPPSLNPECSKTHRNMNAHAQFATMNACMLSHTHYKPHLQDTHKHRNDIFAHAQTKMETHRFSQ